MNKSILTPKEIAELAIDVGVKRSKLSLTQLILLGIFAGSFIAFGGVGYLIVTQTMVSVDPGVAKFLGAAVFPVGLMLVVLAGGELFTGNCLMTIALVDRKIKLKDVLRNWTVVYFANFVGALIIAYICAKTGIISGAVKDGVFSIVKGKLSADFIDILLKGILCNVLVCLAVWLTFGAQDSIGKIFSSWFPIMLFVILGFDHCIANMLYFTAAKFSGYSVTFGEIFVKNLIPATIGNIIGGGVVVSLGYYYSYIRVRGEEKVKNSIRLKEHMAK